MLRLQIKRKGAAPGPSAVFHSTIQTAHSMLTLTSPHYMQLHIYASPCRDFFPWPWRKKIVMAGRGMRGDRDTHESPICIAPAHHGHECTKAGTSIGGVGSIHRNNWTAMGPRLLGTGISGTPQSPAPALLPWILSVPSGRAVRAAGPVALSTCFIYVLAHQCR